MAATLAPQRRVRPRAGTVIGPSLAGISMSSDEFDAWQDWEEGYSYELINGVLIVTPPPPLEAERGPNDELGQWLRSYRGNHPEGAALDDTLPEHTVVTVNRRRVGRVIWAGLGRDPDPREDVPTIVIEFVSKGRSNWLRDYVDKRDEYLAAGVKEYWIVDRFQRTLTVCYLSRGKARERVIPETDLYSTSLLPGFELPLARLLALADRWQL